MIQIKVASGPARHRVNDFLHRLMIPAHRERFVGDFEALAGEFGLTAEERAMIGERKWIEMIRYGVSFFLLETMAPVVGQRRGSGRLPEDAQRRDPVFGCRRGAARQLDAR